MSQNEHELLGRGGMGQVWKANDGKRDVALKFLLPYFWNDAEEVGDGRADRFSLATVAYELLAGYPPFDSDDDQQLRHQIMDESPEAVPEDVPLAVEEVLWKGLTKRKEDRFPTCSEFVAAMERAWQPA